MYTSPVGNHMVFNVKKKFKHLLKMKRKTLFKTNVGESKDRQNL